MGAISTVQAEQVVCGKSGGDAMGVCEDGDCVKGD